MELKLKGKSLSRIPVPEPETEFASLFLVPTMSETFLQCSAVVSKAESTVQFLGEITTVSLFCSGYTSQSVSRFQ